MRNLVIRQNLIKNCIQFYKVFLTMGDHLSCFLSAYILSNQRVLLSSKLLHTVQKLLVFFLSPWNFRLLLHNSTWCVIYFEILWSTALGAIFFQCGYHSRYLVNFVLILSLCGIHDVSQ